MELFISIMTSLTVFIVVLLVYTIFSKQTVSLLKEESTKTDEIYSKLFKNPPEIVARKFGISTDKYVFNCNILGVKPNVSFIIITRIASIFIMVIGILLSILTKNYFISVGVVAISLILIMCPTTTIQSRVKEKQKSLQADLPRFLDLLQTALKINLPITTAIETTAKSVDGVLSDELIKSLVSTELGANNWQDALYDIAQKYEVDDFSDFVLDVTSAFSKGSDVIESVERKSREIKQTSLLRAKESATKLTSTILLPVMIFKMLPLMAILFAPIVIQIMGSF